MDTKDKNKKKEDNLLLGQDKGEQQEQMKFDDPGSRPDPDVEDALDRKDTPFKSVDFPEPPEEHGTYEELLASEEYKHALDKLAELTGERNIGVGADPKNKFFKLTMKAFMVLQEINGAEMGHKQELEELAESVIRKYFKLPDNALQFEFNLSTNKGKVENKKTKQEIQQKEEELTQDVNDITPERAKRRLINAMTQGHSVDGSYLFNDVADDLVRITGVENIIEKYSIVVAMGMLGYWHFPDEMMAMATGGEGEAGAGKSRLDTTTNPPTVYAEALMFPFLIHEGIKGVMEFLGKEKDPEDPDKAKAAMEIEDQVQHEIWDIRLGPAIWRRLVGLFPAPIVEQDDKKVIQYYIYTNIINLPTNEFLVLMKEVIGKSENGKKLIDSMYYDLSRKLDGEEVSNEGSEFRKLIDELSSGVDEEELASFLNNLGINMN